jgi:hypothetical protein
MFVGHYGVSLAAKPAHKVVPLWLLFVAVQWLDICWSVLVMLGIEKLRVIKGFTEGSDLDLYYMPFTHGLIGALALSVLLGGASALFFQQRWRVFLIVAACAFSHWLLDLAVHVADLPLIGDSAKVGFGLWRHVVISFPLELTVLWSGALIYAIGTRRATIWLWAFVVGLSALQAYTTFGGTLAGSTPAGPIATAQMALGAYLALALLAGAADRRTPAVASTLIRSA